MGALVFYETLIKGIVYSKLYNFQLNKPIVRSAKGLQTH